MLVSLALVSAAHAIDYEVGPGTLSVDGSVFVGTAIRTVKQDTELLPNINSSVVGITGNALTATTGRNQDDGNLNFNRGDAVATVLKGYLTLGYKWRDYGAVATGKAWYDYASAFVGHPWGNIPNGFAVGEPLGDAGALARSKFSGIVGDELYGYGHNQFDDVSLDWIVGYQKLDWGNRYVVLGGLRDLNPLDLPALLRPGVVRQQRRGSRSRRCSRRLVCRTPPAWRPSTRFTSNAATRTSAARSSRSRTSCPRVAAPCF